MPKAPIIERDLLFERLNNGTYRLLDWCPVNTDLGWMVEQRVMQSISDTGALTTWNDVFDGSYTRIREVAGDRLYSDFGTSGRVVSLDFNPNV